MTLCNSFIMQESLHNEEMYLKVTKSLHRENSRIAFLSILSFKENAYFILVFKRTFNVDLEKEVALMLNIWKYINRSPLQSWHLALRAQRQRVVCTAPLSQSGPETRIRKVISTQDIRLHSLGVLYLRLTHRTGASALEWSGRGHVEESAFIMCNN